MYILQIFSKIVAKDLQFYYDRNVKALNGCESTIKFCRIINNMFDALNRKIPNEEVTINGKDMEVTSMMMWVVHY